MKKLSILGVIPVLALVSCGTTQQVPLENYRETIDVKRDEAVVMQLADTHWNISTNIPKYEAYYRHLVKDIVKPDLIVLTGDNVLMATKDTVIKQVALLDSLDVPYTFTFGNHDYQGLYSIDWLLNTLENGKNSLFVYQKDDIDGSGNQLVTFTNGGKALWEVYMVDTNSYRETGSTYDYSTIQESQVEWMKEEKTLSKEKYGEIPPAISFSHIPLWETAFAWHNDKDGVLGEMLQKPKKVIPGVSETTGPLPFSPSKQATNYVSEAMKLNTKGFYFGHDHCNDWVGMYEYEGHEASIGFGVKSSRELEYTTSPKGYELTGAASYTLRMDGSYTIGHHYLNLDDLTDYHYAEVTL